MLNNFDSYFKTTIENLQLLDGRLIVLENCLLKGKNAIEQDTRIGNELFGSGLPFKDFTLHPGSNNLFMSEQYYKIDRVDLSDEIDLILSRESLFQFVEAYEILESYLYDQVAEFIKVSNPSQIPSELKLISDHKSIRNKLQRLKGRNNNKHLLEILRNNNDIFNFHENHNIYNNNFENWFNLISEVRHSVVHNRMTPNSYLIDSLPNSCFNEYFKIKTIGNHRLLITTVMKTKDLLRMIAGYVFFVYKAVVDVSLGTKTSFKTIQHVLSDPYYK